MPWTDEIPYTDKVDRFCWERLGFGAEELSRRLTSHQDKCTRDEEAYSVYRYKNTSIYYRVVDTSFGCGVRIDDIFDARDEV